MRNAQGYQPGGLMQLIRADGKQDRMLQATQQLNAQITGRYERMYSHHSDVTDCNTLLLCHYKNCIVATLSIDVVMLICKFINPMFHPVSMFNYLDLKRERTECFNTFVLCVEELPIWIPKDVKKILFKEYKEEIPPPKPFIFDDEKLEYFS